jgi:hypothetical protein
MTFKKAKIVVSDSKMEKSGLHCTDIYNFYSVPDSTGALKSRRMKGAG